MRVHTKSLKWIYLATVALLALPSLAIAQQGATSEQGSAQPATTSAPAQATPAVPARVTHQESHVGKLTGHSESGRQLYYRF
jgi:hypothetical protein